MSHHQHDKTPYRCEPGATAGATSDWQRIDGRQSDVGGILVNRTLPTRDRRMIGPWVFLDHLGPATFAADDPGLRVGPHPHTCLQTFTWMLQGQLRHRDSLGSDQVLRPGEVNLMTAGWGVSHTEAAIPDATNTPLEALQLWLALPSAQATAAPTFAHYPQLPTVQQKDSRGQVLLGCYGGQQAPGQTYSPAVAMDWQLPAQSTTTLTLTPAFEYGIYVVSGTLQLGGERLAAGQLGYVGSGHSELSLQAMGASRVLVIGGEPFPEPVTIWWNYVGHDRAYIVRAEADWQRGSDRFGTIPDPVAPPMTGPPVPWSGSD